MKPLPTSSMERHSLFIDAICQDWLEAGKVTRVTPRADRILEISKQMGDCRSGTIATRASPEPASGLGLSASVNYRKGGER